MVHHMDDIIKLMDTVKKFPESDEQNLKNSVNYADLREDEPKKSENKGASYVVPKIM